MNYKYSMQGNTRVGRRPVEEDLRTAETTGVCSQEGGTALTALEKDEFNDPMVGVLRVKRFDAGVIKAFDTGVIMGFDTGVIRGVDVGVIKGFDTGVIMGFDTGVIRGIDVGVIKGFDIVREPGGPTVHPPPSPRNLPLWFQNVP